MSHLQEHKQEAKTAVDTAARLEFQPTIAYATLRGLMTCELKTQP